MARVNKKQKKKTSGYNERHLAFLRIGTDFGVFLPGFATDIEAQRIAWHIFREQLLYDWIREAPREGYRGPGPGTRPWAWWEFDAPELRRRIDGKPHPFDNPERVKLVEERERKYPGFKERAYQMYYGGLGCLCITDDFEAVFETESAYLIRLGVLLPREAEMIEAQQ